MKIVRTPQAMMKLAARWDRPVALVPTMGALHAGHLALIDRARQAVGNRGLVVVSIFVNPLQFGPQEDLAKYPRPLRRDLSVCRAHGVDFVFHPEAAALYSPGFSVTVDESLLSNGLCGQSRPGHFRGVCTVVAKLFHLVQPRAAVFGTKDFQQLAVIRRMVRDLNFPLKIVPVETVRESDGLAMSSRNAYLSADEREQAPILRRTLVAAAERVRAGERNVGKLQAFVDAQLSTASLARVDYVVFADAEDLQPVATVEKEALLALAVFFGQTRLIDNILLKPEPTRRRG